MGISARIVFWAMTDRRFEDALITVTHARNAADGLGLTHHPGEPLTHGFTSAISVLVPLSGELVRDGAGFTVLRIASLIAFVVAIVSATAIGRKLGVLQSLMIFPLAYLALDHNQIFYGMAGMETQIATATLLAGIYALIADRTTLTGVLLGFALLARPDFVLWVTPAVAFLLLRRRRSALAALPAAALVVFPWVVFASLYYGSPIPNTIRAKSLRHPADLPSLTQPWEWVGDAWLRLSELDALRLMWTPLLENGFVLRTPIDTLVLALAALAFVLLAVVGGWRARTQAAWMAAGVYGVSFLVYRVYFLPGEYYEWYVGPFMALAAVAAGSGLALMARPFPRGAIVASTVLALAFAVHIPASFVLEQRVQKRIEDRVRTPLARYLAVVVQPGERVVSESAGYVGYYSNVTLYDYPGLTSPGALRVLESLDQASHSLTGLAHAARPEWLVLRPPEWRALRRAVPNTGRRYVLAREFKVSEAESDLSYGGLEYASIDRHFLVLRRARP